jgi:hypothetical protein
VRRGWVNVQTQSGSLAPSEVKPVLVEETGLSSLVKPASEGKNVK